MTPKTSESGPSNLSLDFIKEYLIGLSYMKKGFSFIRQNPSYISFLSLPFLLTFTIYGLSFYFFALYSNDLVSLIFPKPEDGWFWISIWYATVAVAYLVVLTLMLFTFMILTNILCSPFYDVISQRIERTLQGKPENPNLTLFGEMKKILTLVKEEIKKALFVAILPAIMLLIPVIGVFLAATIGALFIAWEYIDFSLSRHRLHLKDRLSVLNQNKFYFLGYGTLLMVPFLNLLLFPFAIVGATLLYYEKIHSPH